MKAEDLAERLYRRFKGVPEFSEDDALDTVEDAMLAHGYKPSSSVSDDDLRLILLYAQSRKAWDIALSTAHYFKYTDGEESVDKSMVAENYRKLAQGWQSDYDEENHRVRGSGFRIMKRADRDTLPTVRKIYPEGWFRRK